MLTVSYRGANDKIIHSEFPIISKYERCFRVSSNQSVSWRTVIDHKCDHYCW